MHVCGKGCSNAVSAVSAAKTVAAETVAQNVKDAEGETPVTAAHRTEIGAPVLLIELAPGLNAEQGLSILHITGVHAYGLLQIL